MTSMRKTLAMAMAIVVLSMAPVVGHHAFSAEFDANKPVKLSGTITKLDWVNPHSWLYLDVIDSKGKATNWAVELAAPNAMLRRGWNKNSIPVGTKIVVDGWRAKNGANIANGGNVTLPDGRKLFVASSGTGAPTPPQ
jgi:hypothetical protein